MKKHRAWVEIAVVVVLAAVAAVLLAIPLAPDPGAMP